MGESMYRMSASSASREKDASSVGPAVVVIVGTVAVVVVATESEVVVVGGEVVVSVATETPSLSPPP